jgi:ABC-type antimicrobial peptide transport system permease subunit
MLRNYVKIAFRNLVRNKVYGAINTVGLALSMACSILLFTLITHHLSFDNFHAQSDRIYRIVTEMHRDNIGYNSSVPAPLGKAFRNDYTFAEKVARIATFTNEQITIKHADRASKLREEEGIAFTEPEFFDIFSYPLIQGDKKTVLAAPNTAIVTEKTAKKYFGNANPIGKEFWVGNKIPFTITGLLKDLPENTDRRTGIYVSYSTLKQYNEWLASDDSWGGIQDAMQCFVRLRPNVSVSQVEKVFPAYVKKYRPTSKNVHHYKLQPLADVHFNAQYDGVMEKRNLWILSVIGLFLMATACVNFINLATAQALKRSKEVGVRKVLGGVKRQLFWQFMAETALITLLAAGVALVLSYALLPVVNEFFVTQMSIRLLSDASLPLFVGGLVITVTFFAGSYPGLVLAGFQPVVALKGKIANHHIGGFNTRRTLIVVQFAISQLLIIGMVVMIRQMQYAKQADLGFDKEAILMVPIGTDSTGTKMNTLKNQIASISGVEKISLCYAAPASEQAWNNSVRFGNQAEEVNFRTSIKAADEAYVPTFGLELAAGRNLFRSDTVREFLVNEAFIRKLNFQKPEDALGHRILANGGQMAGPIVGVVKDFHDRSFREEISAVAITTNKSDYSEYAIKLNMSNARSVLATLEKAWTDQYPDQIFEYHFLDDTIARFYETEDRFIKLIQFFSFIAIFIGCLGLYGLVSFMVVQKTKEIGIRKVLGGSFAHILWIFGKEFIRLIVIAFLIAAPIGWWVMNGWLQDFEYQVDITVGTFVLAVSISLVIAGLTVSYQAVKAALANPVKSLRSE